MGFYKGRAAPKGDRPPTVTDAQIACDQRGERLFVVHPDRMETFTIEPGTDGVARLRSQGTLKASFHALEIICHGPDIFVTGTCEDEAALYRLRGDNFERVTVLPGIPRQVVSVHKGIAALMPPLPGRSAQILMLDHRTGTVLMQADTGTDTTALRPATGQAVLAVSSSRGTMQRVDLDPNCKPDSGRSPVPVEPNADPHGGDGEGCACCTPKPSRDPGPRPVPPQRPPRDFCEDGSDGTQDECFVYVVAGFSIICRDICRPGRTPCRRHMHSPIDRIELVGSSLFAVMRGGRSVATLDARALSGVEERALPAPGTLVLTAPRAGRLIALAPDLSDVLVVQAATAALDLDLDLQADVSEHVIEGTDSIATPLRPQFTTQDVSILIIPVSDPGQNYSPAGDATPYADALRTLLGTEATDENAPLRKVSDYFDEQSDGQQNLSFTVFGVDSPEYYSGGPVVLENSVQSYYYPPFSPGGMQSFVLAPMPSASLTLAFRGSETRYITAISSVNAGAEDDANHFPFTLDFAAAIVRLNLDGTSRIQIPNGGPVWALDYVDSSGAPQTLTLNSSDMSAGYDHTFEAAGAPFTAELEELSDRLAEMLAASAVSGDFDAIDVVWGKRPGETRGRIYLQFRFALGGSETPRFFQAGTTTETGLGSAAQIGNFFGIPDNDVRAIQGAIRTDTSVTASTKAEREKEFGDYLTLVCRLAEIAQSSGTEFTVTDSKLGSALFSYGDSGGTVVFNTTLRLSNTHGGSEAGIEPNGGSGPDPLNLAAGVPTPGSPFTSDLSNTMEDKAGFSAMVYGQMIAAMQPQMGGAPPAGWDAFAEYLEGFTTVYTFPVDPPPPGAAGGWSVSAPASAPSLRAYVRGSSTTSDPNGVGTPARVRWGMNFQSFDPVVSGSTSPRESDTRTLGHELGHSLGLLDQYSSTKFDPTIRYLGSLDMMGSSQSEWSHFCAYHKLAVGWWDIDDHMIIPRPGDGDMAGRDIILIPTEWWGRITPQEARNAITNAGALDVVGVAICDLNGDGGIIATIEARSAGGRFSGDLPPDASTPGRVMVSNVLDYGALGRYGQVIEDTTDVSSAVVDGLLRYRRHIHPIASNLQPGTPFDFQVAPGFPYDGIVVEVTDSGTVSVNVDGTSQNVPVYRCQIDWTGRRNPDVGFADNEVEWRSSDLAIDYIGSDPDNPESGSDTWPDGEPLGVGNKIVIPEDGPAEPHRVLVRVRNFGDETVSNVRIDLFSRDPGGGGELHGDTPFATLTIDELRPVDDFGSTVVPATWNVPPGQEPHVCWRAQIRDFRIGGTGANSQLITSDASPTNNWAQQNIFESDVVYSSPPEPLESRFSVYNDGPFTEVAHLEADGLPRGSTLRIRPAQLRVPPFSRRTFNLRYTFDEEMIEDACRRQMDVLIRCIRTVEHFEEPWGASLFKINLKQKTDLSLDGSWYFGPINLNGTIDPAIGTGHVSLRLDFDNGQDPTWISAPLQAGGTYDVTFDPSGISNDGMVTVLARYRGTALFAPSTSAPLKLARPLPEG